MSQHRPVPRLDLAPKLKRPLSLWNPLDYLRLLYWVFFFPQALRCYVDAFGNMFIPEGEMNWRKRWNWLCRNPIERQLILQGLVCIVFPWLLLGVISQSIGFSPNWLALLNFVAGFVVMGLVVGLFFAWAIGKKYGVGKGTASGLVSGVALGIASGVSVVVLGGVASGLALGVASSVAGVVGGNIADVVADSISRGLLFGTSFGVAWSAASGVVSGINLGIMSGSCFGIVFGMLVGISFALKLGWITGVPVGLGFGIAFTIACAVAIPRLENWLFCLSLSRHSLRNRRWQLPHVTPIPAPYLTARLTNWLRQDWETGLLNANQLITYTLQFIPVIKAINQVLAETPPEQLLPRVARFAEVTDDFKLLRFASEKLSIWAETDDYSFKPRLDTQARAAAAGFWYWHKGGRSLNKAARAFDVVRSLPYGEEMFTLASTLADFGKANDLIAIAMLPMPVPPNPPLFRPATWEALRYLYQVVKDAQVVKHGISIAVRAFALNRALGNLNDILGKADTLPEVEQKAIKSIARSWENTLLGLADVFPEISITKPLSNPYVVGDPVEGNLFVGREDVLRQLEEFWVMGHQLQSVVLYGHRRMGKSSILLNAANYSGAEVQLAYVNLLLLGDSPQGVGEVLMAISDAISDAVGCTPPHDADLLNLPYRTFERYLKQVEALVSGGLIVALDEFEKIEELIEAENIPKDFMGYLRGLVQMSSKVAFAFAGLHTLEEMTADYFQPFFASVIPIHVGFLQPGATRQILANPDEDFPLDYTPEALDQIHALTAGQPYLVQLVGFQLVRRYNDFVFEQGRPRDPVFTVEDVEAVINDPEFFKRGRYYFDGVWGQAARGASGQQAILKALAPHPEGLSIDTLRTQLDELVGANGRSPLQEETLQDALKTLTRHDVIQEREGRWQIIVELFRRWVLQT